MNDIKDKEQLPIIPLATLLLSRESGKTEGWTDKAETICSPFKEHIKEGKIPLTRKNVDT
jgi:hypothetical protein